MVVPAKHQFVCIQQCFFAKIHCADFSSAARMPADFHEQLLPSACRFAACLGLQPNEIPQRPAQENVVPRRHREYRHLNLPIVIFNRPLFPVLVEIRMRQPIQIIRRQPIRIRLHRRIFRQRQSLHAIDRGLQSVPPPRFRIFRESRSPRLAEPLLERAALIRPILVIVRSRHRGTNRRKMRWLRQRCQHLCRANIRSSKHSHFSIRIRQRTCPLNRVVTILPFVLERIPFSLRLISTAYVLHNDDVAARCRQVRERRNPIPRFVVRSPRQ